MAPQVAGRAVPGIPVAPLAARSRREALVNPGATLSWGACTDRGLRRAVNEDSYLAEPPLFLIADGMGGHAGGAEASRRALEGFAPLVGRADVTADDVAAAFAQAAAGVGAIRTERDTAGTTLSGAVVCEIAGTTYWLVVNIGDSRTYLLADGTLSQVSVDHSLVQAMVDGGALSADDAQRHPQRNVVTRALGAGSSAAPDYWMLPTGDGDRVLVCSDGVTKELSTDLIRGVLLDEPSPQAAATRLVHEALLRGGRDNTTAVVVDARIAGALDDDPTSPGVEVDEDTRPREPDPEGDRNARV
ncbi:protein phosphatase 2C domain-containing protein [Microbacterium sp. BWT-B31]|uniref:PP2C family protein-serine/threonine phosphatase n=1 Tax=Microbacterium sp. BWT-B31 TaxID=3232072 RepID=UPI0035284583